MPRSLRLLGPSAPLALMGLALVSLAGCPGGGSGSSTPKVVACGNGELNGVEACDGSVFRSGDTCAAYGLADGLVQCTPTCELNFAGCSYKDYCTANALYNNGACDPCDALGGVRDPDCAAVCGADGTCGDVYSPLVDAFTCRRIGLTDPDCGTCGNRILEGHELCDGTAFDPNTFKCDAYGFYGGQIACRYDCAAEFRGCLASDCGDGRAEGFEECDGADARGQSCLDHGGVAGELGCTPDCHVDASACLAPGCMNGVIEPGAEDCEGENLAGQSCESLGFLSGTLACDGTCHFDKSQCVAPGCKNGVKEPGEDCEYSGATADLGGATCGSLGFVEGVGEVRCSPESCTFDTSECKQPGCGNGVKETGEDCEGSEQIACSAIGFQSGTAVCSLCKWGKTACTGGCGNGKKEINETCDGADLVGQSCASLGYNGGALGCKANCTFDTGACGPRVIACGNGKVEPSELCDGTKFAAGVSCSGLGAGTGTLRCDEKCVPDFSECTTYDLCAANGLYGSGLCEPCAEWGGSMDWECACTADGSCNGYWMPLAGFRDTCEVVTGARDPDCTSVCGDGNIQVFQGSEIPVEPCDGNAFLPDWNTCAKFGFNGGTLKCSPTCHLDFSSCN